MSHLTIAEVKRELTRVVAVELTPPSEHSGSQYLKSRYLQNGHITRLIESYARILAALQPNATVAVLGASPLEGFFWKKREG